MKVQQALHGLLGLGGESWAAWRALVGGAFGCELTAKEAEVFRTLTHREPLTAPPREQWWAIGRRGGKNRVSAAVVAYLALLKCWQLAPGETGTVLVLASDRTQAKVAFRYVRGLLESNAVLWQEVVGCTADTIALRNGIEISICTADNAAVRGRTIVAAICDEFAFWLPDEATEVLRALRPGMATQSDAMLFVISTVYAATGPFAEARRAYFGVNDPRVLFAVGTTQQLNPTIDEGFIAAELQRDPVGNAAEYLSIERTDREAFIDAALVDGLTRQQPRELPRLSADASGVAYRYCGAVDVSGGRGDAAGAAVAHLEGKRVIVDACRRWPAPHDPAHVAVEVAAFLKCYGLTSAHADRYGAELARTLYRSAGIDLLDAQDSRSDTYLRLLPLMTTGRVELSPDPQLRHELLGLERRTHRSGKDSVDHRPGANDDVANAVAIAAVAADRGMAHDNRVVVGRSELSDQFQYDGILGRGFLNLGGY